MMAIVSDERSLAAIVEGAIKEEVERVIQEEAQRAAQRVVDRLRERTGSLVMSVMSEFKVEKMRGEILIRVSTKDADKIA